MVTGNVNLVRSLPTPESIEIIENFSSGMCLAGRVVLLELLSMNWTVSE